MVFVFVFQRRPYFECLVMGRDGFVIPGDIHLASKMKTAVSSWVLMNINGETTILDVDKYAIMRRVHIHARDLRILDPLLSYPSTILGRERAIVLNLEVSSSNFFLTFPAQSQCLFSLVLVAT